MADDSSLDSAADDDALDSDLAERFRSLEILVPPDVWARTTGSDSSTTPSGLFAERRIALLVAAAAIVAAGVAALQLGATNPAPVEIADTPNTTATTTVARPDEPAIEPEGRAPLQTITVDGSTIADLRLADGSRFRLTLPEELGRDLRLIEAEAGPPINLEGTNATITIDYGFCLDQDLLALNAQGSAVGHSGNMVRVCRVDEVLNTTITTTVDLTDTELDRFDVRPIWVAGAYKAALTEVWPDLVNCSNCAPWGPMVYPEANVVVHRTGSTAVTAVDLDTLVEVWTNDTGGGGGGDTYLHGGPGLVYLEITNGPLLTLDPATGDEVWRLERDPDERQLALSVLGDDLALVRTSFSGEGDDRAPSLRSVDLATGAAVWTAQGRAATSWQRTDPVTIDGLAILLDVSDTDQPVAAASLLWGVDIETGETVWTTEVSNTVSIFSSDLLTVLDFETGPAVLIRTTEGDVARIDPADGSMLWRVTALRAQFNGTDLSSDGRLAIDLITPSGRRLLDPDTGADQIPVDETGAPACPVTVPDTAFTPPEPWPEAPSSNDHVWFGTNDLWTVINRTGHTPRKSVWWSANFPGGAVEEQPQLHTTYRRLGSDVPTVVFAAPGTNAYTLEDGDFMINGIEPDTPGCWQATATYKGATLSYVYEVG